MFIKTTKSKNYTYVQIVESYREDGKVKHRVLLKLGRLDLLEKDDQLSKLAQGLLRVSDKALFAPNDIQEVGRYIYGHVVYQRVWKKLSIGEILGSLQNNTRIKFDLVGTVFYLSINRLLNPSSKKKAYENKRHYLDMPVFDLHHAYRSLTFLAEHKLAIEEALFRKQADLFHLKLDIVFFDATTFHFESQKSDELRDFGFSKANKKNEVQVVFGLLMNKDGRPIGYELFKGDTFDGKTIVKSLKALKNRFQIDKVIIVADKGMHGKQNLHLIRHAGYDYIVSTPLKRASNAIKAEVFSLKDYTNTVDEQTGEISYSYKSIKNKFVYKDQQGQCHEHEDQIMVSWSASRADGDRKKRMRSWNKAKAMLDKGKAISFPNNIGAKRYLAKDKTSKATGLNHQKLEEDAKWDGYYAIQYSGNKLSHHEAMAQYHELWRIEECFRVMKTTMDTRPVFHWTPIRIEGHFMLCFIAFLMERTLELKLKANQVTLSPQKIKDALNSLQLSKITLREHEYYLKGKHNKDAATILRKFRIPTLKNITPIDELKIN